MFQSSTNHLHRDTIRGPPDIRRHNVRRLMLTPNVRVPRDMLQRRRVMMHVVPLREHICHDPPL
eukprot:3645832-Pyramimonas_sp.AAC.1